MFAPMDKEEFAQQAYRLSLRDRMEPVGARLREEFEQEHKFAQEISSDLRL